jgi:nucleotide-binding universal stress UspA family protein
MKRIVIATDGSAGGLRAVDAGLELARRSGAVTTMAYVRKGLLPLVGDPFSSRRLAADLQRARAAVDEAVARAAEVGVESESEILEGDPAEQILELARLRDADLVIVGSRDLGPITGVLLGSVSRAIVHDADRPVLVVKLRAERQRRVARVAKRASPDAAPG